MKRSEEDEETTSPADDFSTKVNDLDFDPWGTEEDDDGSARRRDPLRKPAGHRPSDDEEIA